MKGTIGTGSMNDPYMPVEEKYNLTGRALQVIANCRFPVHIITKSDRVLRDLDTLVQINQVYTAVSFTITTTNDRLAKVLEPGAPPPSARLEAMKELSAHGILTGVTMMPVLPLIEDTVEDVEQVIRLAYEHGAGYILPCFGMSLRDRQRAYYYRKLDMHFPGIKQAYVRAFGDQYRVSSPRWRELQALYDELTDAYGIARQMPKYTQEPVKQMQLL